MFKELKSGGSRLRYNVSAKERKTLKILFGGGGEVGQFEDFRFSWRVLEPNRGGKRRMTVI
jgi:hypothetical protein